MARHHKSNKRRQRRRTTMIYEPAIFNGSYQRFVKTIRSLTRESTGKMIHNPDGSVTSVSPFGDILTAIYMEDEWLDEREGTEDEQLDERESYEEAS